MSYIFYVGEKGTFLQRDGTDGTCLEGLMANSVHLRKTPRKSPSLALPPPICGTTLLLPTTVKFLEFSSLRISNFSSSICFEPPTILQGGSPSPSTLPNDCHQLVPWSLTSSVAQQLLACAWPPASPGHTPILGLMTPYLPIFLWL